MQHLREQDSKQSGLLAREKELQDKLSAANRDVQDLKGQLQQQKGDLSKAAAELASARLDAKQAWTQKQEAFEASDLACKTLESRLRLAEEQASVLRLECAIVSDSQLDPTCFCSFSPPG